MKKYISLIVILFFMFSCNKSKKQNSQSMIIPILAEIVETSKDSQLFTGLEYITLESTDQSLFGKIDKLIVYNDRFYILDKTDMKKIFVFANDGKFIRKIGRFGEGPGEYSNIEDFTIDESTGNIIVLSYPSRVMVYDEIGNFIRDKKLAPEALLWNIISCTDGYICSTNHQAALSQEEASLIFKFDKDFILQEKTTDVLPIQIPMPPFITSPLLNYRNDIVYFDVFANKVYPQINKSGNNAIDFDFNGQEAPNEVYANPQEFIMNQQKYCFFIDAIILEDVLLSTFSWKGKRITSILNITDRSNISYDYSNWFPDRLLYYNDNIVYSSANPASILGDKCINFENKTTNFPLTFSSNPVILKLKFKIEI